MATKIQRMIAHGFLLESNRDRIVKNYIEAREMGAEDAAVLLLDPEDDAARAIALCSSGEDVAGRIAAHRAAGRRLGGRALLTWGVPRTLAVNLLEEFPDIVRMLSVPLDGGDYWVVVVADGSASVGIMPAIIDIES